MNKYSTPRIQPTRIQRTLCIQQTDKNPRFVFFSFFDSLKISCIKQTNLRPIPQFNKLQVLENPL